MGLVGVIVVICQAVTQYYSSKNTSNRISEELRQVVSAQEKLFVKKEDLTRVSSKLDRMQKNIFLVNNKVGLKNLITYSGEIDVSDF